MTKKVAPKIVLPGRQMDFGEQKVRILEGKIRTPDELPLEVLAENSNLAVWVGRRHAENGGVLDAIPIFIAREMGQQLTPVKAGMVLLIDLARDAAAENRFSPANFSLGNQDQIDEHIRVTYGQLTLNYLQHEYLGKRLGPASGNFLARRTARIMRANYLLGKEVVPDKTRLVLDRPFCALTKYDSTERFTTLLGFAKFLGARWMEADHRLLLKRPKLEDRSHMFTTGDDSPESPEVEAA